MSEARRIVVTGASRGLGAALVDKLVADGHHVIGCARSADAMSAASHRYGTPHRFDALDVSDDAAVERWATRLLDEIGPPSLLINNAGVANTPAPLHKVPLDEFRQVLDVNVTGVFSVIRHLLPAMLEAGHGTIVNLSSGWGRSTSPAVAPYCASKWAIEGMTRALADELPAPLAAIPLNPGVIDTDMLRTVFGDEARDHPDATAWAQRAVPYLISLGRAENGQPCTVP